VDTGDYRIEVNNQAGKSVAIDVLYDGSKDTVAVEGTLQENAVISGSVSFQDTAAEQADVQVYGLDRRVLVGPAGTWTLQVPQGTYSIRITAQGVLPQYIDEISATASQTTTIPAVSISAPVDTLLPEGGFALFSSDGKENFPIYRIDLDRPDSAYQIGFGRYAMISPDGNTIAYQIDTDNNEDRQGLEIHTMNPDGSGSEQLVTGLNYLNTMHWANDNDRLVFSGNADPVSALEEQWHMTGAISMLTLSTKTIEVLYSIVPTTNDYINQVDLHDSLLVYRQVNRIMYRTLDGNRSGTVASSYDNSCTFSPSGERVVGTNGSVIHIYQQSGMQWSLALTLPLSNFSRVIWSNHEDWVIARHTRENAFFAIHVPSGKIIRLFDSPSYHRRVGSLWLQ